MDDDGVSVKCGDDIAVVLVLFMDPVFPIGDGNGPVRPGGAFPCNDGMDCPRYMGDAGEGGVPRCPPAGSTYPVYEPNECCECCLECD